MKKVFLKILKEENELANENLIQLRLASEFIKKELLTGEGDLFLTVDSLITVNSYVTNSNNILLRQVNVKPAFHNRQYMDFNQIKSELYLLVDKFNERQISIKCFCNKFLDKIHPFLDGNGRTCKILFEDKYTFLSNNQNDY